MNITSVILIVCVILVLLTFIKILLSVKVVGTGVDDIQDRLDIKQKIVRSSLKNNKFFS